MTRWFCVVACALVLVVACGAPSPRGEESAARLASTAPKRISAAVLVEPQGWLQHLTQRSSTKGLAQTQQLLNANLIYEDDQDVIQPHLVDAVPSAENGHWKVSPEGRMEVTWRLRPGLLWHDGAPFTSSDLVFSAQVIQDRELELVVPSTFQLIEGIEAPDPQTLVVRWREVFIDGDKMSFLTPMARHILEPTYLQSKTQLVAHPYWRDEFVGTGPYRLDEWVAGSHLVLKANDAYVFGVPKIDEITVRFIPDYSIMVANLMSSSVEMLLGAVLSAEQGISLRDRAANLNVVLGERLGGVVPMWIQFMNPDPPAVLDLEFRRALLRAIDRHEMNETINYGIGPVADTWLQPDRVESTAIKSRIVAYEHDPRRAAQTIEGMGYTRGADGLLTNAAGQRLHIEVRTNDREVVHLPSALAVAEYWKRIGVEPEIVTVPLARTNDAEYRSTFPAFDIAFSSPSLDPVNMRRWLSSSTPLPENRFDGQNRIRYQNPTYDAFLSRYVSAIPMPERLAALGDIIHHQTDQLLYMTFFYNGTASVLGSKRLRNVTSSKVWNAHDWDVA